MPYVYKHEYETVEDIEREYSDVRKHPIWWGDRPGKEARLRAARERQRYLENLEFADQMAPRTVSLDVDLRNRYSVKRTIEMLQHVLDDLEQEVFEVPSPPPIGYI